MKKACQRMLTGSNTKLTNPLLELFTFYFTFVFC